MVKTDRTSKGLAEALFCELDNLINGESTPQQAQAKSKIANTILSVTRLEMEMARFVATERRDVGGENLKSIAMG